VCLAAQIKSSLLYKNTQKAGFTGGGGGGGGRNIFKGVISTTRCSLTSAPYGRAYASQITFLTLSLSLSLSLSLTHTHTHTHNLAKRVRMKSKYFFMRLNADFIILLYVSKNGVQR
jgi:hypothetical protein